MKTKCPTKGKVCHGSYYSAIQALKRLARSNREDVGNLNAFKCRACKLWHIGHTKRARRFAPGLLIEEMD